MLICIYAGGLKVEIFERITSAFAILWTNKKVLTIALKKRREDKSLLVRSVCVWCLWRFWRHASSNVVFHFNCFSGSNTIYTSNTKIPTVLRWCGADAAKLPCIEHNWSTENKLGTRHCRHQKMPRARTHIHSRTHVPIQSLTMDQFFIFFPSPSPSHSVGLVSTVDVRSFLFSCTECLYALKYFVRPRHSLSLHTYEFLFFFFFASCASGGGSYGERSLGVTLDIRGGAANGKNGART